VTLGRRQALLGATALCGSLVSGQTAAAGACDVFEARTLEVPGEKLATRCQLLVPKELARPRRVLVLLHGLGETTSEALGIRAWTDRYGLCDAHRRLRRPPVRRTLSDAVYLTDERILELERELGRTAFAGFAIACPFTPNVFRAGPTAAVLDRYAAWLVERLLPTLEQELGARAPSVGLDGVSLGGFIALEVFLRRPGAFATVGSLQAAIGAGRVASYATRFERVFETHGRKPLRIATSGSDSGRATNEKLAAELVKRGIPVTLSVPPGPHDQRFLREAGTLELLLWHDRELPRSAG
jgi:hypothetical protein